MNDKIIDGKAISAGILEEVKTQATEFSAIHGFAPALAVVLVGEDAASHIYVNNKIKTCKKIGITSYLKKLPADTSEQELLETIDILNNDESIHGILVQLPLPAHIDNRKIIKAIDPSKDVDGFHPQNITSLYLNSPKGFVPCTPLGCYIMLQKIGIKLQGLHAAIVGRSNIVGKPLSMLLLLRGNCSVSMLHSHSNNPQKITKQADILISAVGSPGLITSEWVKDGAVVIDVGLSRAKNGEGKLQGDADFDDLLPKVSRITPVPGGVGPMTIAGLMMNCMKAAMLKHPPKHTSKSHSSDAPASDSSRTNEAHDSTNNLHARNIG